MLALARERHGLQVRARGLEPVCSEVELTPDRRIEQIQQGAPADMGDTWRELGASWRRRRRDPSLEHHNFAPEFARYAAQVRPLCPPPMTTIRLLSVILPTLRDEIWFAQIEQDLARGICAGCGHDAAARVRARAAHVEALRRSAVLREAGERTIEEQLVHRQLALEDIALGEADLGLELARRAQSGGSAAGS
jgi:hypothetical protein